MIFVFLLLESSQMYKPHSGSRVESDRPLSGAEKDDRLNEIFKKIPEIKVSICDLSCTLLKRNRCSALGGSIARMGEPCEAQLLARRV